MPGVDGGFAGAECVGVIQGQFGAEQFGGAGEDLIMFSF